MNIDERTQERRANQERAQAEAEHGPARKRQDAAPVLDAVARFYAEDTLRFGIPAHKGGAGASSGALEMIGAGAYRHDLNLLAGIDNRKESWQVQATAQQLAAEALGADQCFFSTNGSTGSVHAAIAAVARPGEKLAVARNVHKSVVTGLLISGVWPVWLEADYDGELKVAHGIAPQTLERALSEHPDCSAVLVSSPSYYGVCSDIKGLAEVTHGHGIPLVVDEAWGLAYPFHDELPAFALALGADLAVGSAHKTLSALGQTSILSLKGDRVDPSRLNLALELFHTTSTSTLLLAALDAARRQAVLEGERLFGEALRLARRLRAEIGALPGLKPLEPDDVLGRPGAAHFNELHVTFDVQSIGLTGYAAADWLRSHEHVAFELADHRRLMANISHADNDATVDRLVAALRALVAEREAHDEGGGAPRAIPGPVELRTEQVLCPRDAFFGQTTSVPLEAAAGRIAAELVAPYPPGIPIFVPGERITDTIVDYLLTGAAEGFHVQGVADPALDQLRVVAS
jgi:arginine/lysine/ornithine decarboxylase